MACPPEFRYCEEDGEQHLLVVQHESGGGVLVESFYDQNQRRVLIHVPADKLTALASAISGPIPVRLNCPSCGELHIDEGEFATKPHHTHSCQGCGMTWRPAVVATVGVRFLPGFKNKPQAEPRCAQCMKIGDAIGACSGGGQYCAMLHPETAI